MNRLARLSAVTVLSTAIVTMAPAIAGAAPSIAPIKITGGHIKFKLNSTAVSGLSSAHLKLTAKKPAKLKSHTLTVPVKGGTITVATLTAHIKSAGGFTISKGGKKVSVTNLHSSAQGGHGGQGTAVVSGHGRIEAITTSAPTVSGSGPITASNFQVTLAAPLVKILDKKFKTTIFKAHPTIGTGDATIDIS